MALKPVTDPNLLKQLDASPTRKPVSDPALLAQLNGEAQPESEKLLGPWSSALVRPLAKGVSALPLMAMDAGVATRNLLTGENYEHPSTMFNRALDAYTTTPKGIVNKGAEFVSTALAGAGVPAPQAATQAPSNFVKAVMQPRDVTQQAARGAGYVIPPSTTNPTVANKMLESLGGKVGTAQDARAINTTVTDQLARRAVGLAEDTPITKEALGIIRSKASEPNELIRQTGQIVTDPKFEQGIADVLSKYKSAGGVSPKLATNEVRDMAESFNKEFPASDAVDAIQVLRDRASAAYAKGDAETGKGLRALSKVLEDQVERHLSGLGKDGTALLKAFREGRQLIAKTFSVQDAMSKGGYVSATKLAAQLEDKVPLSGDLLTAARFGRDFPQVAAPLLDSGSVRNTDVALGGLAAVMKSQAWPLLYPFARLGVRSGLLSDAGQQLAIPGASQIPGGLLTGGLTVEEQARQGLFGQ